MGVAVVAVYPILHASKFHRSTINEQVAVLNGTSRWTAWDCRQIGNGQFSPKFDSLEQK